LKNKPKVPPLATKSNNANVGQNRASIGYSTVKTNKRYFPHGGYYNKEDHIKEYMKL